MVESLNPKELPVGDKKIGVLLRELGVEVSAWNKTRGGIDWDKAVWATDTIRKGVNNDLELVRNGASHSIALLKTELKVEDTSKKVEKVPTTKKEIVVTPGDSITKILVKEFGKGNFSYGNKSGPTGMKDGWDKINIGEKLTLETDGKPDDKDMYLYTLSRDKNGINQTITFVSSKLLLEGNKEQTVSLPNKDQPANQSTGNLVGKNPEITHPTLQELEKMVKKVPEQANTLKPENLKNVFPNASATSIHDLYSGKIVRLGNVDYQLAKGDGNNAVIGSENFQFADGVRPESTDIILVATNQDKSKVALAFQKLKSGKYSSTPR